MDTSDIHAESANEGAPGSLSRERHFGLLARYEKILTTFSPAERLLLYICTIGLGIASFGLLLAVNASISSEVPTRGGVLVEGEAGPVRFVNPVLAISQADQDVSQVVFSGLMRIRPDGTYIPDLAESYTISPDGTTYVFTLRRNARFHDGTPLTSADVLYTIAMTQNPDIRSPHRADWDSVAVSALDPYTVQFTLPHAYAPFIENTTMGILPKHLWESVSAQEFPFSLLNTHPVGTGPYAIAKVSTDISGTVTRFDLAPFDGFVLPGPYMQRISFAFYATEDALLKAFATGQIDAIAGINPSKITPPQRTDVSTVLTPLPRIFAVFFNENHNAVLADIAVRKALDAAIDKNSIVQYNIKGLGVTIDGPIPPNVLDAVPPSRPSDSLALATSATISTSSTEIATTILKKAGWTFASSTETWTKQKKSISLKLATVDEPELVSTANSIAQAWRTIGIDVRVEVYPLSDFNNTVLRPRDYDAILFGEVVGRTPDLFAFWHSSQRNDPGLNLAMYANARADALLSKARAATDTTERNELYREFAAIIQKDVPALFLYSPDFVYIVPKEVHNIALGALTIPAERFLNVHEWYTNTERVWNFFLSNNSLHIY